MTLEELNDELERSTGRSVQCFSSEQRVGLVPYERVYVSFSSDGVAARVEPLLEATAGRVMTLQIARDLDRSKYVVWIDALKARWGEPSEERSGRLLWRRGHWLAEAFTDTGDVMTSQFVIRLVDEKARERLDERMARLMRSTDP